MRMIGQIGNETEARAFHDFLYAHGIENQIEADRSGSFDIWVIAEDDVARSQTLFETFLRDPKAPAVAAAKEKARQQREKVAADQEAAVKRMFDADDLFNANLIWGIGRLTFTLVLICAAIWLLSQAPQLKKPLGKLFITQIYTGNTAAQRILNGLVEIRRGELWRLVTPIFLHFHILHILFNMLWLKDLGTLIEVKRGSVYLLLQVLVIGVVSNLGQYYLAGPAFGGMSGVVYGLLGFIWMKGKYDPNSGFFLHPTTVAMMLIWLCFGFTGIMPIANGAHTVGLVAGMIWGLASAQRRT
jgi:GlpG protein